MTLRLSDLPLNDTLRDGAPVVVEQEPEVTLLTSLESTMLRVAAAARNAADASTSDLAALVEMDDGPTIADLVVPVFAEDIAPRSQAMLVPATGAPTVRSRPRGSRLPRALHGRVAQAIGIFAATMLVAAVVFLLVRPS